MKQLELTEDKAKQLNDLCQFAVDKGILNVFDINYYQRQKPNFDIHYYRHLLDVASQYDNVNKLIDLSSNTICATHNTNEFLKSGGFLRLVKIEEREDKIQDFTLRNLKQSIFATKDWWMLFLFTTATTIAITQFTGSSKDEKTPLPTPIQDSTKPATKTNFYHQDTSYQDSLNNLKFDTN